MARKRSRRDRKREQKTTRGVPPGQLLQQGRQQMDEGDPRQALESFKRARSEDGNLQGLDALLFCAYSQRARQLATKGMAREAAAMREMAQRHGAAVVPRSLSAGDLVRYIRHLETAEAVQVYAKGLGQPGPDPQAEQVLADRLVASRRWDALAGLDEDHPLRRDAETVKQAIVSMDAGAWEQAGATLGGIARRSPFAPWRIFCKAMASFAAGDDDGLRRALDQVPKQFILAQTVDELRTVWLPGPKARPGVAPTPVQQALGTNVVDSERLARDLAAALRQARPRWRDVEALLPPLAKAIYPEAPIEACVALLEIIGIGGRQGTLPLSDVLAMRRLLPPDRARAAAARIELVNHPVSHQVWNVAPAATYLAHLGVEFPDASQQTLARARVLEFLARSGHQGGACAYCVGPSVIRTLREITGKNSGDPGRIFADLMLASLEADPDNREGYRFLLELLRAEPSARPRIERALTDMAARFPDDPDPCLELATLHYSRNAYRKAEVALAEARKRAPHDERILDRQAIGYMKSGDQNRGRGNYPLAERDLQRAEALGRRRPALILLVKRLGLKLMAGGQGAMAEVGRSLDPLPPFEQLRALALLILDLAAAKNVEQRSLASLRRMLDGKGDLLGRLSAEEVVGLLAPVDADFQLVFPSLQVAPVLADWCAGLLARVQGDDLITLFDTMLACGQPAVVRGEIDRRLKGRATPDQDPLLRFYLAVIRHAAGETYGSVAFKSIIDDAPLAQRERLRAAAARLAQYGHGPLREALQRFSFDILDSPLAVLGGHPPGVEALLGDLVGTPDDGDEPLDGDEDEEPGVLAVLEKLLDDAGVRGASLPALQDVVGALRSDPLQRRELDEVARAVEDRYDELSRELRVLLFPRRKGRSRRQ